MPDLLLSVDNDNVRHLVIGCEGEGQLARCRLQISMFYGMSCSMFGTVYNNIYLLHTLTSKNLRQFTSFEIGCG
jgi:hypothetical protein